MAIYVDPIFEWHAHGFTHWSHMGSDDDSPEGLAKLHAFARRLGLRREWFDGRRESHPHYDVTPNKRNQALKLGAISVDNLEYCRRCDHGYRRAFEEEKQGVFTFDKT